MRPIVLVDGSVIPQHPFHPNASTVSADVPVMLGSTRTELTSSAQKADFSLTDAAMRTRIQQLLGRHGDEAIQVYRKVDPGAMPSDIYFLIASDYRYSGPGTKIAERRAALGKGPYRQALFTREFDVVEGEWNLDRVRRLQAAAVHWRLPAEVVQVHRRCPSFRQAVRVSAVPDA